MTRDIRLGRAVIASVGALPLVIIVTMLVVIVITSFRDPKTLTGFTLANFEEVYNNRFVYESLVNTLWFTIISVATSLFFGIPIAFFAERTTLLGRGLIFPLMTISILVPGFFTAMGWLVMFHPRVGIVNRWLIDLLPISSAPFNVVSLAGMGFVQGIGLSPLAYIMLAGVFRATDPALEESAQIHGLGPLSRFWKITLPLVFPGTLAAAIYVAMIGLAAFDVPAIIGLSNRIFTFSTFVFTKAQPEEAAPNYGLVGAASVLTLLVALASSWWYLTVIKRSYRYAVVTGKNYRPKLVKLSRWSAVAAWAFIGIQLAFALFLPLLALVWASLLPFFRPVSRVAIETVSLDNFRTIPWDGMWLAGTNTLILMLVVPTVAVIMGIAISWVVVRSGSKAGPVYDTVAFLPHAVPNLIFAVAALVMSLFWIPNWIPLYGTLTILIVVFVVTRLSFPTRLYNGALLQIHKELDEAGYVFGLGAFQVLCRVTLPLLAPVMLYTWIWMALLTYRELTVPAFLVTKNNVTLTVFIWGIFSGGNITIAAATSLVMIGVMLPLVAVYFLIARRWSGVPIG